MPLHLGVGRDGLDVEQGGVQLVESLEPPLVAGSGQVSGKPSSDLEPGPSVKLVLELHSESRFERLNAPRQVDIPTELATAWDGRPDVVAVFEQLSYTHQREYAEWVASAKQQATRDRRAAKPIELLAKGEALK